MIRTTGLGILFMLVLAGVAAGAQSLATGSCSDWVTNCHQKTTIELAELREGQQAERD